MNPSSYCRAIIFEEEFKFQYIRRDIHVHIVTQTFLHFCQSRTLPGSINMGVSPNIWNRSTFQTTSLFAL